MKKSLILLVCLSAVGLLNCKRTNTGQADPSKADRAATAVPYTVNGPSIGNATSGSPSALVNLPPPIPEPSEPAQRAVNSASPELSSPAPEPASPPPGFNSPSPGIRPSSGAAFSLPRGTTVPVRLQETLDTKRNRAGDRFTATLDEPLVSGDRVVVPKGTPFFGHLIEARSSGRFKGRAVMTLALDSFQLNGQTYRIRSTDSTRVSGRHRKRNWLWIGGGAGGGALVGAAAGGRVGGLIGAGAGAAAGTVGAALTGKKEVRVPVETRVTFKLQSGVNVS